MFRYATATARTQSDPTIALRDALIRPQVTPRATIAEPKAFGAMLLTGGVVDAADAIGVAAQSCYR